MLEKIKPLKHLGQNFLKSITIAKKIISLLGDIDKKNIYEIGPGMGALTEHILNTGANLTCFDIDKRSIDYLKEKFINAQNLTIIHSDIRNIIVDKPVSIIGNIPYNITNDVLFWLLANSQHIDKAVLTVQKEVAKRYTAKENTKDYGITTLALKLFGSAKICFNIPAAAFVPAPKIVSSVLLIEFDAEKYKEINKAELMKFIRAAFSMRRKILSNSLKQYFSEHNIDLAQLSQELSNSDKHYLKCRAEQLKIEDYISFFDVIGKSDCSA